MEILDGLSKDLEQEAREKLQSVFPDCFVEGKLDIDKLLNLCGEYITDDFERYNFTWKGKAECLQLAQKRSSVTLRPCPEESVDFAATQNLYIEGDNLEVLKLLQNSYHRKVKMIYIDPPYNTGHDFVYEDDFKDPVARYKEIIGQATKSNPETMGRFHTNWLNMMYPRLRLAANLLRDDGVIFISIDDNEVHNLRKLCDETFGEENFVAQIVWQKRTSPDARINLGAAHDYILVYAKNLEIVKQMLNKLPLSEDRSSQYKNPDNDPRGPWASVDITGQTGHATESQFYELITPSGQHYHPPVGRCWALSQATLNELVADNRIWFGADGSARPRQKKFLSESDGTNSWTWWANTEVGHNQEAAKELKDFLGTSDTFENPKPTRLLTKILMLATKPVGNDIILDFFSGSATTAQAVMQLNAEDGGNRRFICVQLPEQCDEKSEAAKAGYANICEIGKERIRRAGQKIQEEQTKQSPKLDFEGQAAKPLDAGFKVFKLDTSNLRQWDSSPIPDRGLLEFERRLNEMMDSVKPDRTELDMIYEVMLKMGRPLTEAVIPREFDGKMAYCIREDNLLVICLAKNISQEAVKQMAALAPARLIFGQECFADMSAISNAKLYLRNLEMPFQFIL